MPDPEDQPKELSNYPDWPEDPEKVESQIIAERKLGDLKPGNAVKLLMAIDEHKTASAATTAADALDPETTFPRPTPVVRTPPTQAERAAPTRQHQAEEPADETQRITLDHYRPFTVETLVAIGHDLGAGRISPEDARTFTQQVSAEVFPVQEYGQEEKPRHVKKPSIFDQAPRKRGSFGDSLREGGRRGLEMARGAKPRSTPTPPKDVTPSEDSAMERAWTWLKKH